MKLRIAAFVLTVSHFVNSISASVAVAHSAEPDGHFSVAGTNANGEYLGRNLKDDGEKCVITKDFPETRSGRGLS